MKCARMHLSDRRYKPPPVVSKCDPGPVIARPCVAKIVHQTPTPNASKSAKRRSCRSSSPQTSNSEHASALEKTPLIIVNLKIAPDAKTLAPKGVKSAGKKLPPYCVQYQNSLGRPGSLQPHDANMKVINDFLVQGTLIGNQRRKKAHTADASPDIVVDCDDTECGECDTTCESTLNMFSNINTDLLLSLDYYEMDSYGRLPGDSRANTPIVANRPTSAGVSQKVSRVVTPTLLGVPVGYRPLALRTPSPNTRAIIRVDLISHHRDISAKSEASLKDIDYNINRLKEKRGVRSPND